MPYDRIRLHGHFCGHCPCGQLQERRNRHRFPKKLQCHLRLSSQQVVPKTEWKISGCILERQSAGHASKAPFKDVIGYFGFGLLQRMGEVVIDFPNQVVYFKPRA